MIVLASSLSLVILALLAVVAWAIRKILMLEENWHSDVIGGEFAAHAKCTAHVAKFVGDEYAAQVLEAAAADYDSAEGHHQMKVLARLRFQQGGRSMPAIWMQDRADRLRDGHDE